MILRNARALFADGVRDHIDVRIARGKIAQIGRGLARDGDDEIDLDGNHLAPGFIDLHVHGGNGRDTMEGSREAFRAICDFHATGGTTSLLLTTVTAPLSEVTSVLNAIREFRRTSPRVLGAHVEGPFISAEKPGAQRKEFIQLPSAGATAELLASADVTRQVTLAPELPGALQLIDELVARGIRVSGGHSDAWDEDARAAFQRGMRQVTHTFNCMSSARRRGAYRVAGLLEFALSEREMLCEVIADGHHVAPTLMKKIGRAHV